MNIINFGPKNIIRYFLYDDILTIITMNNTKNNTKNTTLNETVNTTVNSEIINKEIPSKIYVIGYYNHYNLGDEQYKITIKYVLEQALHIVDN